MDEKASRGGENGSAESASEEFSETIPSKHLPPVAYREMPEPLPLRRILGPSVVMAGVGLASSEYILWPYVTSKVGLVFLWAVPIAVLTQFFVNMEVERYTLATGETAVTGFTRLWKPWGVLFVAMAIIPSAWPAWASGSATAVTLAYDIGEGAVLPIAIVTLVVIGAALTVSPVVYRTVEKVHFFKFGALILFLAVAVVVGTEAVVELAPGTAGGFAPLPEGVTVAALLSALLFAGAGGAINLVLSNWIRDKGLGMGAYIPRVVSPFTGGEESAAPSLGYMFPQDEENLSRWRAWWKNANREHFVGFFLIAVLAILIFSLLAYPITYGVPTSGDFDFILVEGAFLSAEHGNWFGTAFWMIGAISLLAANLGIVDYVSRLAADSLKVSFLARSGFWSESKLYVAIVWAMVACGCLILLGGLTQPVELIVISAALSGVVMFVYSILLIVLNRTTLPEAIRIRGFRLGVMGWAVLFFGACSVILIVDQVRTYTSGQI